MAHRTLERHQGEHPYSINPTVVRLLRNSLKR